MGEPLGFDRLVHSDWSKDSPKRWTAIATRQRDEWNFDSLNQTPSSPIFCDLLLDRKHKTLAGFDFAIGLPSFYERPAQQAFSVWLSSLNDAEFDRFADVADDPADISASRPFYPYNSRGGKKRFHLLNAHGCSWNDLFRQCELRTSQRDFASPLFWTLGGKQVGRAALAGWREILRPAISKSARIWPFDGSLRELSRSPLTLCETYPAEAYVHIGLRGFKGKRQQAARKSQSDAIRSFCIKRRIQMSDEIKRRVEDGFSTAKSAEDQFDAFVGLLSMIGVVDGHSPESPPSNIDVQKREGWILGQNDLPKPI